MQLYNKNNPEIVIMQLQCFNKYFELLLDHRFIKCLLFIDSIVLFAFSKYNNVLET